jgi:hypothetical protein
MQKCKSGSYLGNIKLDGVLWQRAQSLEVDCKARKIRDKRYAGIRTTPTSQIPSQHQIQHKKAILVILESISQIDDEWVVDLRTIINILQ